MALPNIFTLEVSNSIIDRINQLKPDSRPLWGKMSVDQMLAHCSVTYGFIYTPEQYKKAGFFMRLILKFFVKKVVTNEVDYKASSPTAPDFVITGNRDFEAEKAKLIGYIQRVQQEGPAAFDGKESFNFGVLNLNEWNNMLYKHLDHHLRQFGV